MLTNEEFFDEISESYDNMILFKDAVEKKKILLKEFINNGAKSAADLGCGTGVDSIAISKLGLNVAAFDISGGMINKAKLNAEKENTNINFINKSITEISKEHFNKYDFIVSLGNSLANIDYHQLEAAIKIIKNMLKPGGKVLIQVLNYIAVLNNRKRIVNITNYNKFTYIRFYDFTESLLQFNILKYHAENPKDYKLISTRIYPHAFPDFEKLMRQEGFKSIKFFGSINKTVFEKDTSKDLVIFAEA